MRLVVQRVTSASVTVMGELIATIDLGLLVLVGFGREDEKHPVPQAMLARMARKLVQIRIFPDDSGKLDQAVADVGGHILAVSQFTLHADCRKGRRPSLHPAADPRRAETLFKTFVAELDVLLPSKVQAGRFGQEMDVALHNWGPLTLVLDSQAIFPS